MEKVLQEFRIIETDDGFRIEIKGDKEQLREFVMNLDPRQWTEHGPGWWGMRRGVPPWEWHRPRGRHEHGHHEHGHHEHGHHEHGHHGRGRGRRGRGPGVWFGFGGPPWEWGVDEEEEGVEPKAKRDTDTA
jgi:hypothetical protein